jgi:hypothetical protein
MKNRDFLRKIKKLDTAYKIQTHLSSMKYNIDESCNSPAIVLKKERAHCLEGAFFAAACLENIGHKPLIMDLRAVADDDHTIAVYKSSGLWGAISKSNFTTLGFREPVHRSLRELAMSYFDFYHNINGQKTLREYSRPMNLSCFKDWKTTCEDVGYIGEKLDSVRHYNLLSKKSEKKLSPVEKKLIKSSLQGADARGIYKPGKSI